MEMVYSQQPRLLSQPASPLSTWIFSEGQACLENPYFQATPESRTESKNVISKSYTAKHKIEQQKHVQEMAEQQLSMNGGNRRIVIDRSAAMNQRSLRAPSQAHIFGCCTLRHTFLTCYNHAGRSLNDRTLLFRIWKFCPKVLSIPYNLIIITCSTKCPTFFIFTNLYMW